MGDIRGLFEKKFTESTDISERGLLWQGMRKFSFSLACANLRGSPLEKAKGDPNSLLHIFVLDVSL